MSNTEKFVEDAINKMKMLFDQSIFYKHDFSDGTARIREFDIPDQKWKNYINNDKFEITGKWYLNWLDGSYKMSLEHLISRVLYKCGFYKTAIETCFENDYDFTADFSKSEIKRLFDEIEYVILNEEDSVPVALCAIPEEGEVFGEEYHALTDVIDQIEFGTREYVMHRLKDIYPELVKFINEPEAYFSEEEIKEIKNYYGEYSKNDIEEYKKETLNPDETELSNTKDKILPIELFIPADKDDFRKMLLKSKSATITIHYNDNTTESKEWNASKITKKSDIIRNLRSRQEFRRENWQKANINHKKRIKFKKSQKINRR